MNYKIMSAYPLGGDAVEKLWWPRISKEFPNYEKIWSNLIVHLTNRPVDTKLRSDLSEEWESFAQQHYSIYLHLAVAINRNDNLNNTILAFEEIYSHIATSIDIFESFLVTIKWIINGEMNFNFNKLEDKNSFLKSMEDWFESKEREDYLERVRKSGRYFAFNPFKKEIKNIFEKVTSDKDTLWKEYSKFCNEIRPQRNIYIHEFAKAKLIFHDGRTFIPKDFATLRKYHKWSEIEKIKTNLEIISEDFVDIFEISTRHINEMLSLFNKIWGAIWQAQSRNLCSKLPRKQQEVQKIKDQYVQPLFVDGITTTSYGFFNKSADVISKLVKED